MPTSVDSPENCLKLQEICRRLQVDYDDARYALAKGALPHGVVAEPGRGNHRLFKPPEAFMLAIILKLRSAGVSTSVAKDIGAWSLYVHGMAVSLGWDWQFALFAGPLHSTKEWYLDVGDRRFARIVTNASPTKKGYHISPWVDMKVRRKARKARPAVVFRVDIVRIAQLLAGCDVR